MTGRRSAWAPAIRAESGAAERALVKAGERSAGAVAASDGFFPFRDGLDVLAEAGITAIVEPGGSIRDDEVIAAAQEHDVAIMFTTGGISDIERTHSLREHGRRSGAS